VDERSSPAEKTWRGRGGSGPCFRRKESGKKKVYLLTDWGKGGNDITRLKKEKSIPESRVGKTGDGIFRRGGPFP